MTQVHESINVQGAYEHNLKGLDVRIERGAITVVTGVSGSGKSSLAFDTVLAEAHRRFFYTLSHYSRQFLDMGTRPAVRSISGLSPAISLAQNETQPSRRASVGTLTDASELIGVMFARFGDMYCPEHHLPTEAQTPEVVADRLIETHPEATVAICAMVAESKKGIFAQQLTQFAERGYLRAWIDGKVVSLSPLPQLAREEKHTIKLLIDQVKVKASSRERLRRSIATAIEEGKGFGEAFVCDKDGNFNLTTGTRFSIEGGCPACGFSWPRLDSRYFSANSLGRCPSCNGFGMTDVVDQEDLEGDGEEVENAQEWDREICSDCEGTGLNSNVKGIKLAGWNPHQLHLMPIRELRNSIETLKSHAIARNAAFLRVAVEVTGILERIDQIGLGYLNMARRVRSLSGGEAQRLKLAGILAENLRGVLYVLDEPSQGLHPADLDRLWDAISKLKSSGNTVIIVDHDESIIRRADWIIDLGPGGGAHGGQLMAKFKPQDAKDFVRESVTAKRLAEGHGLEHIKPGSKSVVGVHGTIAIDNPRLHNLTMNLVEFQKMGFNVVTGVSGAGKSSLVLRTLYPNVVRTLESVKQAMKQAMAHRSESREKQKRGSKIVPKTKTGWLHCDAITGLETIKQVALIDRKPVAKSNVSMPASYLDVLGHIRDLYADMPEAQISGLSARSFSLHVEGGRCNECKGRGEVSLSMRFLADARVRCSVCQGRRYKSQVLDVKYQGLSIGDVLELTIDQAREHFKNHKRILGPLDGAAKLGLGYLKLGQPSASLSGGEAQRLKLVPFLNRKYGESSLLIIDEPTTGLHFEDVKKLLISLHDIHSQGATLVIIEHNSDIIRSADWVVDLGPGSAQNGGQLVFQGSLANFLKDKRSLTSKYLND